MGKKDDDNKKASPPVNVTHPLRYYEFTQDEIRVLEECDRESFYQRCLPLSTIFASVTYAAIKSGYLSASRHFGATPKVLVAGVIGYISGRLSYINCYDQKIRTELPCDSHLGRVMRQYHTMRDKIPAYTK